MAFGKAMEAMGSKKPKMADSKMGGSMKGKAAPKPEGKVEGEGGEGESSTTITHHADGSHSIDGEQHPTHLHMLAALGHKVTGGDKHHIAHHDGLAVHTHGIRESGEHAGPMTHNSAEEAKEALGQFLDEEAQEPQHEHGGQEEQEPAMGAYGG